MISWNVQNNNRVSQKIIEAARLDRPSAVRVTIKRQHWFPLLCDKHSAMKRLLITLHTLALLLVSIIHTAVECKSEITLETSFDSGMTWHPHKSPHESPPPISLIRLSNTVESPIIQIPSCALISPSLTIRIWKNDNSTQPFALSWENPTCYDEHHHSTTTKISTKVMKIKRDKSVWADFVLTQSDNGIDDDDEIVTKLKKNKTKFMVYMPYILIFVGMALGHGIRKGYLDLQEEAQLEQDPRRLVRPQQIKAATPRNNRSTLRSRKKNSTSSSSTRR